MPDFYERADADELNSKGIANAKRLIRAGKYDTDSAWSFSADDGNTLLGKNGDDWANYAKWFLVEDTDSETKTKSRYKYPFGKDGKVFRRGLIAAKAYAAKEGLDDLVETIDGLLSAIEAAEGTEEDACASKKKKRVDRVDSYYAGTGNWSYLSDGEAPTSPALGGFNNYLEERMVRTAEGFLRGRAILTTVGVFSYKNTDGSITRELRPPEEVFDGESLDTLKMKPVMNTHKISEITPDNIKEFQVGNLGDDIRTDAYNVSLPIIIQEGSAISDVQAGRVALSCGYKCDLEDRSGVWNGVPFDKIQRRIRYNHVATVDAARAGDAAKLRLDSADAGVRLDAPEGNTQSEGYMLRKVNLDGVEYEAEEKVIDALKKSEASVKETVGKLDAAETKIKALESETEKLKGERDGLKDQLTKRSDEALEPVINAAVARRVKILDAATKAGVEVKVDMQEPDIQKAVILKAFPKAEIKGDCSKDYLDARFDSAVELLDAVTSGNAEQRETAAGKTEGSEPKLDEYDPVSARKRMIAGFKKTE